MPKVCWYEWDWKEEIIRSTNKVGAMPKSSLYGRFACNYHVHMYAKCRWNIPRNRSIYGMYQWAVVISTGISLLWGSEVFDVGFVRWLRHHHVDRIQKTQRPGYPSNPQKLVARNGNIAFQNHNICIFLSGCRSFPRDFSPRNPKSWWGCRGGARLDRVVFLLGFRPSIALQRSM